jgi:two-component system sensor histidine kinase/response regulator
MQSHYAKAQPRILVVDDEPRNRKLLEGYLATEGYRVSSAEDGQTALSIASRDLPDVVLLDIMMPQMTGHEVCRLLKADARTRICQVMMVTALSGVQHTVEGLDTGADDYVSKPIRREEFLAKVRALLRVSRLLRDLEAARTALTERNEELQLKKDLAQMLVHDLKSPLAAILGNLDLLAMVGEQQWAQLVERSQRSATRLLRMILDLLDVERLESGRIVPDRRRVNLAALARAAMDEADVTARLRRVMPTTDTPGEAWIDADPALVRRVLDNLIANSIAHSPEGTRIQVSVRHRDEGVELSVIDSGPGVPPENREEVFEKYAQLQQQSAGNSLNKGLGLTFCRLVVEALGGTIWVEKAPEGGACFKAILPEAAAPDASVPAVEVTGVSSAATG